MQSQCLCKALGLTTITVAAFFTPALTQAQSVDRDTVVVALGAESNTMDPIKLTGGVDHYYLGQMFEQLVRANAQLEDENWLAESWTLGENADGKPMIAVRLRDGVKFHNGDPMTTEDVAFSFARQSDPASSYFSFLLKAVERIEVLDRLNFNIHFKYPDATFVVNGLQLWIMPKKYIETVGDAEFGRHPIGTGPWKFVSRSVKDELRLEAFEDYWNQKNRPGIKNLVFKIIPEDMTRVSAFKTGRVDWLDNVPPAQIEEIQKMPGVKTVTLLSGNNLFINFGGHLPNSPFKDARVRLAAAHAIDVDAIIQQVLFGQGERYAQVGRGSTGYDPDLKPFAYDPKRARELLREAGFANGFTTPCYNLTTPREPNIKEVGEAMFAYLSAVGIRCQVRNLEYGAWLALAKRSGAQPMDGIISWMWSHGLPGDPSTPWLGHMHSYQPDTGMGNNSYDNDAEMDALLEQQEQIMDLKERAALLQKIARIKQERVLGGVPTYRSLVTFAWRDNLDYVPWSIRGYWRVFQEVKWQ